MQSPIWTPLPSGPGVYWRRITLSNGTIYSTRIQNVMSVHGVLTHANDNWNFYYPILPIKPSPLVTWNGPLVAPMNDSP